MSNVNDKEKGEEMKNRGWSKGKQERENEREAAFVL